ncbi:MAG: tRNA dihydrouridine synthase, partial [Ruminococcus sp.]
IIDINMGCPVPKVVNIGCGSALMKDINTAFSVAESAVKASKIPVTIKFRSGWDNNSKNAVEFAKAMESAGVSAITVHGRTREQFYSGEADWNIISEVKKNVSIPVIGNGDIKDLQSCLDMYEKTGCDLVMTGRASYGNPFIFDEIKAYSEGREYIPPSLEYKMQIMLEHIRLMLKFSEKPENIAIREARKISAWYMNGYYGSAKFRAKCYSLESYAQAEQLAEEFLEVQKKHSL